MTELNKNENAEFKKDWLEGMLSILGLETKYSLSRNTVKGKGGKIGPRAINSDERSRLANLASQEGKQKRDKLKQKIKDQERLEKKEKREYEKQEKLDLKEIKKLKKKEKCEQEKLEKKEKREQEKWEELEARMRDVQHVLITTWGDVGENPQNSGNLAIAADAAEETITLKGIGPVALRNIIHWRNNFSEIYYVKYTFRPEFMEAYYKNTWDNLCFGGIAGKVDRYIGNLTNGGSNLHLSKDMERYDRNDDKGEEGYPNKGCVKWRRRMLIAEKYGVTINDILEMDGWKIKLPIVKNGL